MSLFRDFRPALLFLGKFLALYFVGNILYGIYIESFGDRPDPVTRSVTSQTVTCLNMLGYQAAMDDHPSTAQVRMKIAERNVLSIFEGCNGINVLIVFVSFLFAFGGPPKKLLLFLPLGLIVIHVVNLLRLSLLFYLALDNSRHFYYFHKYVFTSILYLVVFALWALWVAGFNEKRNIKTTA